MNRSLKVKYIHTLEYSTSSKLCDLTLNRDYISQCVKFKNLLNNPDVDQSQHTERSLKPMVYVLSKQGEPLMPCTAAKAKRLLKKGAAKVVKRIPFTIQLNFGCGDNTQEITCGIDPGYSTIGFSCVTEKKELISGEVELDNMMSKRLQDKAMYRRTRRNRLWYRKPRFLNRSIPEGWLAPSVKRRLQTHIILVEKLKKILPISRIILEVANFDIQKIINPDIESAEYQQGNLYQYNNIKSYLITREHGKCQLCEKEKGIGKWRIHHIIPRKDKGSDRPSNLALLHEKCHTKLHKENLNHLLKKPKIYKAETFMNIIRWKLKEILNTDITFGCITHQKILESNLEKTHYNDAFVIADGRNQERCKPFKIIQKRKNNRCLQLNRKGFKLSTRKQRYKFRPLDLVKIKGKIYEVVGVHSYGTQVRLKDTFKNILNKAVKKLDNFHYYQGTLKWRMSKPYRKTKRISNLEAIKIFWGGLNS